MKSAQLAAYEGVCLLAFALSMTDVVSAASPELSDEEKIELIKQGDWQALGLIPQPPRAPETDEEKLAAIRGQRDGSLEIAREMLARELPATRIEALNAMSNYDSREALDLLREYVVRTDRLDRTRFNAQARWAGTFRNRFGEQADGLAIHAIEDPARSWNEGPAVREVESSSDRYLHYSSADP